MLSIFRLNEVFSTVREVQTLLKLVVEKMEIRTEADEDENDGQLGSQPQSRKPSANIRIDSAKPAFVNI